MIHEFTALEHHPLSADARIALPPAATRLSMESPAPEAMTDLRRVRAATIAPERTADDCNALMIARGVRLLLVVDASLAISGVITATDLLGDKPVRFMRERSVRRSEILVSDLMTPVAALESLDVRRVVNARVGHIVATLKAAGRQHTFVTDEDGKSLCGIFSANEIARRLGVDLPTHEVATTFAQIEAALGS